MDARLAVPADLASLNSLLKALPALPSWIAPAVLATQCLVAVENGSLIGCGVLTQDFFERGFVKFLYVAEGHRRRGIGCKLLGALEARCTTAAIFASTNSSNLPMQKLLAKSGYRPSGAVEGLDPDDPELFYRKQL